MARSFYPVISHGRGGKGCAGRVNHARAAAGNADVVGVRGGGLGCDGEGTFDIFYANKNLKWIVKAEDI